MRAFLVLPRVQPSEVQGLRRGCSAYWALVQKPPEPHSLHRSQSWVIAPETAQVQHVTEGFWLGGLFHSVGQLGLAGGPHRTMTITG